MNDDASLEQILESGIACMHSLKAALIDERDALERRDANQLAGSAQIKELLAEKLAIVDRHGAEIGALAARDGGPLRGLLQTFQAVARECGELNQINGTIIHLRRRQIMDTLSVLRGQAHDEDTYTPKGSAPQPGSRRKLTEA